MAICSLCNKDHNLQRCPRMKGCGKCQQKTTHKASGCGKPYPKYDEQICDKCMEKGHEAEDCTDGIGDSCKTCGHGDHTSNQIKKGLCPLVGTMSLKDVAQDVIDQFTPKYRAIADKIKEEQEASSSTPPVRTVAPISSPSKASEKGKPTEETSPGLADTKPLTPEEERAAQLIRWKMAEKYLPAKQPIVKDSIKTASAKANFFKIAIDKKVKLFKYSISFEEIKAKNSAKPKETKPDDKEEYKRKVQRETKRFLIGCYLGEYNKPDHDDWACDCDSTIVSVGPLYQNETKLGIVMPQPENNSDDKKGQKPERSTLSTVVQEVGQVDMEALINYVAGKKKKMDTPDDQLRLLNIISWKAINQKDSGIGKVGNKIYPRANPDPGVVAKRKNNQTYFLRDGFFSSMRPGEDSVLLNVNTVTTAFLSPINLHTWMKLAFGKNFDTFNSKQFCAKLKGIRVTLDLHKSSRTWIICDCKNKSVSETKFDKEGKRVSVSDYLKQMYSSGSYQPYRPTNADLKSPCINLGTPSRQIWYPANVLTILDWQIAKESVHEAGGVRMVDAATRKPDKNVQKIMGDGLKVLGIVPLQPFWKKFGLHPKEKMVNLDTKIISGPKLIYVAEDPARSVKQNEKIPVIKGGWNLAQQDSFMEPRGGSHMLVLSLVPESEPTTTAVNRLAEMMKRYKMRYQSQELRISWKYSATEIADPQTLDEKKEYRKKWQDKLSVMIEASDIRPQDVTFLLIILPKRSIAVYQEVKRWADCLSGYPSICVTKQKLEKAENDASTRANICLKINFKLKGVSHWIDGNETKSPLKGPTWAGRRTMIVGADVTHPGKSTGCPSMAAIVATDDDFSGHYLGSARLQTGRQEYIADLEGMMTERVLAWHAKVTLDKKASSDKKFKSQAWNLDLPERILFYRDGVSESQYGMVLEEEKNQIMRGCAAALEVLRKVPSNKIPKDSKVGSWVPKLTLIVVTKRHHARFYPYIEPQTPEADVNLGHGTVVETEVVTPHNWSFYLQSHHSELGTARSALYVVIYDDCQYTPRELQKITNNICWTSARATKILSVCTPARYADILCDRLRCYMKPALEGSYSPRVLVTGTDLKSPTSPKSPSTPSPNSPKSKSPNTKSLNLGLTSRSSTIDQQTPGNDEDGPRSVEDYAADDFIWMKRQPNDGRKNPWHPNLDDSMFYL